MSALIEAHGLWEGYRPGKRRRLPWRGRWHWALCGIDLTVRRGELLGVVGRNGSGKTTLLQVLGGVILPTKGVVQTEGKITSLVDLSAGFHRDLSGRENVLMAGVLLGMSRAEARSRYADIAAFSELDDEHLEDPLSTYSAGMTLRLGFALAVHTNPAVLLVDEVLAVGDEAFQAKCIGHIESVLEHGGAVVLVSHDLDLVAKVCHRVIVLDGGRAVFEGAPTDAVAHYRDAVHGGQGGD